MTAPETRDSAVAFLWANRRADLSGRSFVALDAVLTEGSAVAGQILSLTAEAQSLEMRAPDDQPRASANQVRGALDDLAETPRPIEPYDSARQPRAPSTRTRPL
jgi:hypothetical protein